MAISGPTMIRRQLGRRLRRMREAAGKTASDVAETNLMGEVKLWRIETGRIPIKVGDTLALCRLYGADASTADALATLAAGTNGQGWSEDHDESLPEWFRLYVGLEGAADRIHTFEDIVVPGEFQTADYARAVLRAARPGDADEAIERHVQLRMQRQQGLLDRTPPPRLVVVLGETVLTRPAGGPDVLAEQVQHLRDLDQREHVEIRVLPLAAGAHAAMAGAFRVLDFDDEEDPDLVYLEAQTGARYLEKPGELDEYRRIFGLILKQAVPIGRK